MTGVPKTNATGNVQVCDLLEQLRLLEGLPAELRHLVESAPIPMDLREVTAVWVKFGLPEGLELISQVLESEYPGWRRAYEFELAHPPRLQRRRI